MTTRLAKQRGKARRPRSAAVYLSPAAFERWIKSQGVSISHKSLYKTYLGKGASNPIERNARGLVHKLKGLEMIRLVQGREVASPEAAAAKRIEASARAQMAKAIMLEAEAAERIGRLVPLAMVNKTWGKAIENTKNELLALPMSVASALRGLTEPEIRDVLAARLNEALRHLAAGFIPAPKAAT